MIGFAHDVCTGRMMPAQKGANPTLFPWLFQAVPQ